MYKDFVKAKYQGSPAVAPARVGVQSTGKGEFQPAERDGFDGFDQQRQQPSEMSELEDMIQNEEDGSGMDELNAGRAAPSRSRGGKMGKEVTKMPRDPKSATDMAKFNKSQGSLEGELGDARDNQAQQNALAKHLLKSQKIFEKNAEDRMTAFIDRHGFTWYHVLMVLIVNNIIIVILGVSVSSGVMTASFSPLGEVRADGLHAVQSGDQNVMIESVHGPSAVTVRSAGGGTAGPSASRCEPRSAERGGATPSALPPRTAPAP